MPRFRRYQRLILAVWILLCGLGMLAHASLYGPWQRYTSASLGFEIPCVADWWITRTPDAEIFGLQEAPETPVRLAIGRIRAGQDDFAASIGALLAHDQEQGFRQTRCLVAGHPAIRIDGRGSQGPVREYYVDQGRYWYWITFTALRTGDWERYARSFDIIISDFRFL